MKYTDDYLAAADTNPELPTHIPNPPIKWQIDKNKVNAVLQNIHQSYKQTLDNRTNV